MPDERPSIRRRLVIGASRKPVYAAFVVVLLILAAGFLVAGTLFVSSVLSG